MANNEKMSTFKNLLFEYIKSFPGADGLPYLRPDADHQILLEILACFLDHIPTADLPVFLPTGAASDLATLRINQIKRKAVEEMEEPVDPVKYSPTGYSQEILHRDSELEKMPKGSDEELQHLLETIQSYEAEIASLNETIEELVTERDHAQQLVDESKAAETEVHNYEDEIKTEPYDENDSAADNKPDPKTEELHQSIISLEEELSNMNKKNLDLVRECDYWKQSFEDLEDSLRSDAAKNNLEVSKKYKLSKLSQVEFLNNLIATEHYSIQQISFIQHCLLQNIPIKNISECVSAALPVSIMEDYISYSCRKNKIEYQPYHFSASDRVPPSGT